MDKSKLIAIVVLVLGIGCIAFFKEKPLPAEGDDHDDTPAATVQAPPADSKPFDAAGGVTKLKSEDLHVGDGTAAKTGDDVSVNYRGTLLNGEMFDESYGRGPFDFKLGAGGVIKGWDQGVVGMKVGGKRKLTVPADLAYGNNSPSPKIPAGATLVFEVELLKVNGKS